MVDRMDEGSLREVQEEVDEGGDEAAGVYITWKSPASVSSKVAELIRSQQLESPFLEQAATFSSNMQKSLSGALLLSGFQVELEDDLRPFGIRVIHG
ncbi:hypothetical protein [Streptomyces sp. Ag109_G2-15]|uniref:hypothetical protein n=1 Tax=Streptomyces sp. Ag109_G2-15 TaxID=1938850 RepID=UPI000C6F06F0|nr:hypothetical protein [Streptomyces sp. Ag109_G2-15]